MKTFFYHANRVPLWCYLSFILISCSTLTWASPTIDVLISQAQNGDKIAQYQLGLAYDIGEQISLDHEKAVYWYLQSAKQGYAEAQYNLATSYHEGEGVDQHPLKAAYWYQQAAIQGHPEAQNNLGVMYEIGLGVPKDPKKALYWYTQAAKNKSVLGQFNVGDLYASGRDGIDKDPVQAYAWFAVAEANGEYDATYKLAILQDKLSDELLKSATTLTQNYLKQYHRAKKQSKESPK